MVTFEDKAHNINEQIVNEFLTEIVKNTTYKDKFFEFYLKDDYLGKSFVILEQMTKERLSNGVNVDPEAFRGFLDDVKPHSDDHSDDSQEMNDWKTLEGSIERFFEYLKSDNSDKK